MNVRRLSGYLLPHACGALAFSLPFPFIFPAVGTGIAAVLGLLAVHPRQLLKNLVQRPHVWSAMLFAGWVGASVLWSANRAQAIFDFTGKLSFLVLPLALGCGKALTRRQQQGILLSLIAGLACAACWCYVVAFNRWQATGSTEVFVYHKLVQHLEANAVYMSWYVVTALAALLIASTAQRATGRWPAWAALLTTHLAVFLLLLSSKALLLVFLCGIVPVALYRLGRRSATNRVRAMLAAVLLTGVAVWVVCTPNPIRSRFAEVSIARALTTFSPVYVAREDSLDNLSIRTFVWRVGFDQVRRYNLWWRGCGAGDVQTVTDARMYELGIKNMYEPDSTRSHLRGLNLHNMYLQALVMTGVPGLALLLWMVCAPVWAAVRRQAIFPVLAGVISILILCMEAAFQTQAGVVFYAFLWSLFWNRHYGTPESHIAATG